MKRQMVVAILLLAAAPALASAGEDAPPASSPDGKGDGEGKAAGAERWAGHQIVVGKRSVPVIGEVQTRTDTWLLAQVVRAADGTLRLEQRSCKVEIAPAAGVEVAFLPGAEPKLPPASLELRRKGDLWYAAFESGWDEKDADGDGKPGVTMQVDAPLCSGRLFVTSASRTQLRGRLDDEGFRGEARAISDQKTLDADGACLRMMASDQRDRVRGTFAYVPVPADASCESLAKGGWPVTAAAPRTRR